MTTLQIYLKLRRTGIAPRFAWMFAMRGIKRQHVGGHAGARA